MIALTGRKRSRVSFCRQRREVKELVTVSSEYHFGWLMRDLWGGSASGEDASQRQRSEKVLQPERVP